MSEEEMVAWLDYMEDSSHLTYQHWLHLRLINRRRTTVGVHRFVYFQDEDRVAALKLKEEYPELWLAWAAKRKVLGRF